MTRILVLLLAAPAAAPLRVERTVREPPDHAKRVYRGVPLAATLPDSPGGDALLVRCADGFVALLPIEVVRRRDPILADEVRTGHGWAPVPPPRGPRYLVWPSPARADSDHDAEVTSEEWAWNVVSIEPVDSARHLAPLALARPTPRERRGRALWMGNCFHCHALRGAGGIAGWDLAEPTPLWGYLDEAQVARYLRDPRSVNPDGHMPPQPLTFDERRDLFAFLHAVEPARVTPTPFLPRVPGERFPGSFQRAAARAVRATRSPSWTARMSLSRQAARSARKNEVLSTRLSKRAIGTSKVRP